MLRVPAASICFTSVLIRGTLAPSLPRLGSASYGKPTGQRKGCLQTEGRTGLGDKLSVGEMIGPVPRCVWGAVLIGERQRKELTATGAQELLCSGQRVPQGAWVPGQLCEWLERHGPPTVQEHYCWPLPDLGPGQKVKSGISSPQSSNPSEMGAPHRSWWALSAKGWWGCTD